MEGEAANEQAEDKHKLPSLISRLDTYTNDSGYSSDVITSPELSRECLKGSLSVLPCLTPDVTRQPITRLTSTPHCLDNQEIFCSPIPKLEVHDVSQDSQCNFVASSSSSTSMTLEMCELEVVCMGTSNLPSNIPQSCRRFVATKEQEKRLIRNQTERQKGTLSRVITRRKTSQWVFVRMLREADYLAVRVLKYLSGQDLLCLSHVNTQLRSLILRNKELGNRRTAHIVRRRKERERVGKENYREKKNENPGSNITLSPRKHLSAINNLNPPSPKKAPATLPVSSSQSEKFIEEGRKLPKDQELQKCVKCHAPARVQKGQQRATCSCGYDYCTRCYLPYHPRPQDCPSLKPRTRGGGGIFSTKCKRSLRRL